MGGSYEVQDGTLVVGAMITTEMACDEPLMAQDQWISAFVNGASVSLAGDTLTLVKDDVTLNATDREVARPDLPLEGTRWTVDGLISNQAISSMPLGVEAWLELADGKVALNAGCNRGSGAATIGDTTILFGPIGTTKMGCEADAMQTEAHILAVLQGEVAYEIDSDTLTITGAGGGLTAKGTAAGS
jgi:heat shock protein HslJ